MALTPAITNYKGSLSSTLRNGVNGVRAILTPLFILLLALGLPLGPNRALAGEAAREGLVLELQGTALADFVMICDLVGAPGAKTAQQSVRHTVRRRAMLPHSYRFDATAIDCRITMLDDKGRLEAFLYDGERLLAAGEAYGLRPAIGIRSRGPWGAAAAWRELSGRSAIQGGSGQGAIGQ